MITAAAVAILVGVLVLQAVVIGRDRLRRDVRRLPRPSAFAAAIVVGATVRLAWVVWATRAPVLPQDPAEYLRIATELGDGILPRFAGLDHSAYWPPGYPAVLAPFLWVAEQTGWASPAFTASLVNVAAGTLTVAFTGMIAGRWLGPPTRPVAAWLVAVGPGLVYFTATAHTETVFSAVLLGSILVADRLERHDAGLGWVGFGLLAGAAFLVRSPGVIVWAMPALVIRAARGRWRPALRPTLLVVAGAAVLLVPWTVRNGVQVGFWSPASTNNAAAACFGHNDGVVADWETSLNNPELQVECFRGSPYDDRRLAGVYAGSGDVPAGVSLGRPDEVRWYRETMGAAIAWALTHPREEAVLVPQKIWATWKHEGAAVDAARNYSESGWAGRWHDPLDVVADLWLWGVGGAALLALVVVPSARRALPVWVPIVALTLAIAGGVAEPHYRYPVVPLVAVLASGLLCRRSPVSVS